MEISKSTHLMVDIAGALVVGAGLILVLKYFGADVYIGRFTTWGMEPKVIQGNQSAAQPASNADMDSGFMDDGGSGEQTAWAATGVSQSDTYYGYNYLPPNAVPAGILPNPLAPDSTQAIGGAQGQPVFQGATTCTDCGG